MWTSNYLSLENSAILNVIGGGIVNSPSTANVDGSAAVATVDGTGSTWATNYLDFVRGQINISNGGTVTVAGATMIAYDTAHFSRNRWLRLRRRHINDPIVVRVADPIYGKRHDQHSRNRERPTADI